ncbi:MAG: phosphatase PAP2 family protein [Bacteroidales bacterium]|nr:phosphatase PAP2 family protein [Bacteroidales bacterium]
MRNGRRLLLTICTVLFTTSHALPQDTEILHKDTSTYTKDSIQQNKDSTFKSDDSNYYKFKVKQLVLPASMIGIGILGVYSDWLESKNYQIKDELRKNIDKKITIDVFSQYVPMAAVYGLNLAGLKGYHNLKDRTIILATSYLIMSITVESLKRAIKEERPDKSNNQSFPSGHTATAFMGAEFLWREYKDVSPWIGITGYAVAAGTGFFRMYNNKHWLTDVIAGAGIGILSTKIGYWLYPTIKHKLFKDNYLKNVVVLPYYNMKAAGICCMINL